MDVVDLSVPFETSRDAEIAFEALRVDAEPKRGGVEKQLSVDGNVVKVHFRFTHVFTLLLASNSRGLYYKYFYGRN